MTTVAIENVKFYQFEYTANHITFNSSIFSVEK